MESTIKMSKLNKLKPLFIVFRVLAIAFIGFCIVLYFRQDSMLFHPRALKQSNQQWITDTYPNSNISISIKEGLTLKGWLLKRPLMEKQPLVIYFGGNSEELSSVAHDFEKFTDYAFLLINYRGFGESDGQPSQDNLFSDALTIYDHISQREDIDKQRIVVVGRSLGTGVAVYLAAHRALQGVILISPYDSITHIAQKRFPFIPVSLLIKHPFDSIALAPSINTPMLSLVAEQDTLIPPQHSYDLAAQWGGAYKVQLIESADHLDIPNHEMYWKTINQFLLHFK